MGVLVPGTTSRAGRWAREAAFFALLIGLAALAWAAGDGVGDGLPRLVRVVGLFTAAGLGVAAPHLLFPDPDLRRLHLANPDGRRLLARQERRWWRVLAVLAVPPTVLAIGGGWRLVGEGFLAAYGVGLYALARALPLGPRMQRWERGEAGGWYHAVRRSAPPVYFLVPDALIPGILLTAEVFLVGAVVAVAGQTGWGTVAAAAVLAVAAVFLARQRAGFARTFWASNGVWADAFYTADAGGGREPLGYAAVYWSPPAVRPAVWAGLVSLDRRLPLGRIAALGLAVVAVIHVVETPTSVRVATLALWIAGVNGASGLIATDALTPGSLARRLHGPAGWTLTRFLINVRWLPPFAAALALLAWLADGTTVLDLITWTVVYLFVAAASAALATLSARFRYRRAAV